MNLYIILHMGDPENKKIKVNKKNKKNVLKKKQDEGGAEPEWKRFQKKEEKQHILDRPDTFIGSTEIAEADKNVQYYSINEGKIESKKKIKFIPGLYKIFDEVLVNAADNVTKTRNMAGSKKTTEIRIEIEKNRFAIQNNGNPIPIQMHEEEKMWVPELIFGHLRTSDNYDDGEDRFTGGRNGYGSKLAILFSTSANIKIKDKKRKKTYTQTFEDNLHTINTPIIEDEASENMVRVECFPDFKRFEKSTEFSDDMIKYLTRRSYDVAATTPEYVKVYLNDELVPVKNFLDYVKMYEPDTSEENLLHVKPQTLIKKEKEGKEVWVKSKDERWEVVFVKATDYRQVSFVNNINTFKGGKHVNYVTGKIKTYLHDKIKTKHPHLKKDFIDNYIHIYVNCMINQPAFGSQCKEDLSTNINKFGSKFEFSKDFLKQIDDTKILDDVLEYANLRAKQEGKKNDGKKSVRLKQLEKLHDAPNAGKGSKAKDCILILTEGLSAASLALKGLSAEQRKWIGVYPLRGKVLNVRDEAISKINKNEEINDIKASLGLSQNQVVTDVSVLRYGRVYFMTDQDFDGFHIKGLLMNLFDTHWDSLYRIKNFFGAIRTPILKASYKKDVISFYTEAEHKKWKKEIGDEEHKKWSIKYYKGLGTSDDEEAIEYFSNLEKNTVFYNCTDDEKKETKEKLDMIFNKKRARDRKGWLNSFNDEDEVEYDDNNSTNYVEFFDKEFIFFSNYDNHRSIPRVEDGLKPGQRKILYSVIKRNLKKEIKVNVLGGYVTETSHYHHGDAAMNDTITKMAQVFTGSNNINYLHPKGQFGSRIYNGADAAQPRYIETRMTTLLKKIIRPEDSPILTYQYEDNDKIEPITYYPIIPMLLVNGTKGIGTGYSTDIPSYNPEDLVKCLQLKLQGKDYINIHPYFAGFVGTIRAENNKKKVIDIDDEGNRHSRVITTPSAYTTCGKYSINGDKIHITEIPIGMSVVAYKKHLDSLVIEKLKGKEKKDKKTLDKQKQQFINSYEEICTDYSIDITIHADWSKLQELMMSGKLENTLKLESKISTTNMVLFNPEGKLQKYKFVHDIIDEFYKQRYKKYEERLEYEIKQTKKNILRINEKIRFLILVMEEKIVVFRKSNAQVTEQLIKNNFKTIDKSYDFLLSMPISSFTDEKLEKLNKEKSDTEKHLEELESTEVKDLWNKELEEFLVEYRKFRKDREAFIQKCINRDKKQGGKGKKKARRRK